MKGKYLNPKADVTFKRIFGEHPQLVKSLLNALLPLDEGKQIESVEYAPAELVPENPSKKGGVQRLTSVFGGYHSVVDVRCKETGGRHFIVEMQMNWNNEFQRRVVLNASKAVVKQLDKGEDYTLLQPVYSLNLINDVGFDAGPDEFYHDYAIVNVAHTDRIIEGLRFVFVELPKFKPQTIAEKKMAVLWLKFLTEIDENTEEVDAELLENPDTAQALQILDKSAYSEGQLYAYEYFWDAVVNERVAIEGSYKKGHAEGEAEGLAKGLAEGRAEGRAEGLAKGEAIGAQKKAMDNARKMKSKGFSIEDIVDITGLSREDIAKL